MKKLKTFWTRYKHAVPLLVYSVIYMTWFCYLERSVTKNYRIIHMTVDDRIPFCEFFIIPYLLWFVYVTAVVIYLFFKNKSEYTRACVFLFTGMTVFLIVSSLWPNGHHLRPYVLPRDNIFSDMVRSLWRTDTPTNLWPSIHVYNSLGAHFAIMNCTELQNKKGIRFGSLVLAISIILSTMFLKQHSVFDVLTAFAMAAIMYAIVYGRDSLVEMRENRRARIEQAQKG